MSIQKNYSVCSVQEISCFHVRRDFKLCKLILIKGFQFEISGQNWYTVNSNYFTLYNAYSVLCVNNVITICHMFCCFDDVIFEQNFNNASGDKSIFINVSRFYQEFIWNFRHCGNKNNKIFKPCSYNSFHINEHFALNVQE